MPTRPEWYEEAWDTFDKLLLVEGRDDATFVRKWLDLLDLTHGVEVKPVDGGKTERLREGLAYNSRAWALADRDELEDETVASLEAETGGRLLVLPRYTLENYFIHPDELWEVLPDSIDPAQKQTYTTLLLERLNHYTDHCCLWKVLHRKIDEVRAQHPAASFPNGVLGHVLGSPTRLTSSDLRSLLDAWKQYIDPPAMIAAFEEGQRCIPEVDGSTEGLERLKEVLSHHVHGKELFKPVVGRFLGNDLHQRPPKHGGWREFIRNGVKKVPDDLAPLLRRVIDAS